MIELRIILPGKVSEVWENISGWVEDSLGEDKSYTVEDVKSSCLSGENMLWVIYDEKPLGFLTTTLLPSPQGPVCYCPWLGGLALADWVPEGFKQLKEYMKAQGCLSISWMGRAAWKRLIEVDSVQCYYSINL